MKTEEDYRVTYEVAKLMKQADYVGLVTACYYIDNGEVKCVEGIIGNGYNSYPNCYQAPLTAMALDWANELRYNYMRAGDTNEFILWIENIPLIEYKFKADLKDFDMAFLTAVCSHIITNKTNK